jgi:hypothetical protein
MRWRLPHTPPACCRAQAEKEQEIDKMVAASKKTVSISWPGPRMGPTTAAAAGTETAGLQAAVVSPAAVANASLLP